MSKFFWILFLFSSSFLLAQNSDTIFIQKVDSLINVAATFSKERNFDKALEINDLAQTISMDHFGPNSTVFGSVSFQYGRIFYLKGDHTTAEKWFLTAISILEKANSKNFPKYADALYDLGCLYDDIGKYTESEALLLNAKDIRAESLGKSHADYQENLVSLGILYYHLHNYERAGEYYKEANALALLVSGKNSFTYCNSLHNLAQLYSVLGKNDEAERYYLEAIDIHARLEGTENASHAVYLNNLGILYKEAGMYNKAESLFQESLQIREKVFGKEHPRYAKSLNSLGNLYHFIGENDKAEEVLLQAISILEKTQVKPDITYANCLGNLGGVYRDLRQFELAEQTLLKSEDVMEVIFGKDDVECTWSLMNLGLLYRFIGNFDQASALFLRSKDIREKSMGKENTYYEECLDQLALLYWAKGDQKSAITYLEEANEIEQRTLSNLSQYSSEHGLASFIHNFSGRRDRDFSFCQVEPSISGICYNNTLFHKGFLLNSVSQVFKNAIRDSTTNEQFNNLKALHRQIAAEYTKPLVEQKDITSLEERANTLEKILTRTVSGFGEARQQVDWEAVKNALKPDEIAIEFVHYNFLRPLPTDSIMYAALVIRHGSPKPVFIPLFEEKQLKALLKSDKKVHGDFVNDLYANTAPNDLYALVWQPMEPLIKAQKIYFSPSGLLHRLNLSAIPINDKELLADRYQFVELGSTRQLAIPAKNDYKGTAALLYGGIQYDIDPTSISTKKNATEIEASIVARSELNFYTTDSTLRGGQWNFLKWTEVEVNATEGLLSDAGWSSVIRKGSEATEASVKAIGLHSTSPRVLHLATHGFFFPDPANSLQKPNNATQELVFKISDSPMIRSGLILAGGNYAWKHGKPFRPDMEDGILTAYEISQMNLSNTELVVLSACETGLGDIQGNEGVYGLQRAFKIAGAKYLIMSLWQVPDFQTQELMTTFYTRWIEDKMTVPEAFQSAQKTMQEKYKEPFLWAGFVLVE